VLDFSTLLSLSEASDGFPVLCVCVSVMMMVGCKYSQCVVTQGSGGDSASEYEASNTSLAGKASAGSSGDEDAMRESDEGESDGDESYGDESGSGDAMAEGNSDESQGEESDSTGALGGAVAKAAEETAGDAAGEEVREPCLLPYCCCWPLDSVPAGCFVPAGR
jgi:hypothetical protein